MVDHNNTDFDARPNWIGRLAVLRVCGDMDILTAPALTEAILAVLRDNPAAVIADLSDVKFLGSAGITALVTAHTRVTETARFIVVADSAATSRPIRLVGLDTILTMHPTLERAVDACADI